jgi:ferredoxin
MVIITINRDACVSCGTCWDSCPGFFEQNADDSFSQVKAPYRIDGKTGTGRPPADAGECARDAAGLCPSEAISAEEE